MQYGVKAVFTTKTGSRKHPNRIAIRRTLRFPLAACTVTADEWLAFSDRSRRCPEPDSPRTVWRHHGGMVRRDMCKTLIVEDNLIFRHALKALLQSRFPTMHVEEARDEEEALEKVDAFIPDVIFMDIKLSGASGLNLTRQIKGLFSETVVIVLTSYDLPEYREAAKENGASYFLCKGNTTTAEILDLMESLVTHFEMGPPGPGVQRS